MKRLFQQILPYLCLVLSSHLAWGSVVPINEISPSDLFRIKQEIIAATKEMHRAGVVSQTLEPTTIFPVSPQEFDYFLHLDIQTGLSQVFLTEELKLAGFLIAHSLKGSDCTDLGNSLDKPDPCAKIEKFGVFPAHRNTGIGKQMMQAFARKAYQSGLRRAELLVLKKNEVAQNAYQSYGFRVFRPSHEDLEGNAFLYWASIPDLINPSRAIEGCLSDDQKNEFWKEAFKQLGGHPRILFDHGIREKGMGGWITSNEDHYYTVASKLPNSPADIHVGFGTLPNFNIIGARPGSQVNGRELPRTAILADISPEVVVALMSFWRPLWLASDSPREWLAFATQQELLEKDVASLFEKAEAPRLQVPVEIFNVLSQLFGQKITVSIQRSGSSSHPSGFYPSLEKLKWKLRALQDHSQISSFDYRFITTLLGQDVQKCQSIFSRSGGGQDIHSQLSSLYDPQIQLDKIGDLSSAKRDIHPLFRDSQAASPEERSLRDREILMAAVNQMSFLHNPEVFARNKRMFEAGTDFYALTNLEDQHFWDKVGAFATNRNKAVTDVYVSCIPQIKRNTPFECRRFDQGCVRLFSALPRSVDSKDIYLYESTCSADPSEILVREF